MPSHNKMHPPNCYSGPLRSVWYRPTGNKAQRTQPERAHQTTDRPATQPPSPPTREESTDSNLKRYNIDPKERLPSGHTLPWRAWRTSNRMRSGQAATPAAKPMWGYRDNKNCMCGAATCDLNHIMTSCTHFGERPSLDDIAEMKDVYVRWLRAIADTI